MALHRPSPTPGRHRWRLTIAATIVLGAMLLSEVHGLYLANLVPPHPFPRHILILASSTLTYARNEPAPGVVVQHVRAPYRQGLHRLPSFERGADRPWLPRVGSGRNATLSVDSITLPLWPFALLAASGAAWSWRRHRRARPARCRCGYDLAGLAADRCPECGTLRSPCESSTSQPA